jgi:hypothetical protein
LRPFSGVTLYGDETRSRRGDVDGWYDIGDAADLDLTSVGILRADFGGMRDGLRLEISEGVWIEVNDDAEWDENDELVAEQIGKLIQLRDQGVLTPEEFEAKKAQILAGL